MPSLKDGVGPRQRSDPRRGPAAAAVLIVAGSLLMARSGPAAAQPLPDPNEHGFVGLCDANNQNVTSGDIHAAPFVWKAVASQPPPAPYRGRGENTILNIYQPRPGVDPGEWSGDSLTGTSFYSTSRAPAAQATRKDIPLAVVVGEFPPLTDGLYQLRMYFGKTNYGVYTATYPATTIRVQGDRWSVVSGGTVNCAAAAGSSAEVLTGAISAKEAYGTAAPQRPHGRPSSSPSEASVPPDSATSASSTTAAPGQSQVAEVSDAAGSGGGTGLLAWWVAGAAAALAAIAGGAWLRLRTRSRG